MRNSPSCRPVSRQLLYAFLEFPQKASANPTRHRHGSAFVTSSAQSSVSVTKRTTQPQVYQTTANAAIMPPFADASSSSFGLPLAVVSEQTTSCDDGCCHRRRRRRVRFDLQRSQTHIVPPGTWQEQVVWCDDDPMILAQQEAWLKRVESEMLQKKKQRRLPPPLSTSNDRTRRRVVRFDLSRNQVVHVEERYASQPQLCWYTTGELQRFRYQANLERSQGYFSDNTTDRHAFIINIVLDALTMTVVLVVSAVILAAEIREQTTLGGEARTTGADL